MSGADRGRGSGEGGSTSAGRLEASLASLGCWAGRGIDGGGGCARGGRGGDGGDGAGVTLRGFSVAGSAGGRGAVTDRPAHRKDG